MGPERNLAEPLRRGRRLGHRVKGMAMDGPGPKRLAAALLACLLPMAWWSPAQAAEVQVPPWTGTITVERTTEGSNGAAFHGSREVTTWTFGALLSGDMDSQGAVWRQTVSYSATYEAAGGGDACSDGTTIHSYSERGSGTGTATALVQFRSPREYLISASADNLFEDVFTVERSSNCQDAGFTFTRNPVGAETLSDGSWDIAAEPLAASLSGTTQYNSQFDYTVNWQVTRDGDADDDGVADGYDPCPLDPEDACAPQSGTITIQTQTHPDGSTQPFQYRSAVPSLNGALSDGGALSATVDEGTYTVTQDPVDGWANESITCNDTDSSGSAGQATIAVGAGENVICTFTNEPEGGIVIEGGFNYRTSWTTPIKNINVVRMQGTDQATVSGPGSARVTRICLLDEWTATLNRAGSTTPPVTWDVSLAGGGGLLDLSGWGYEHTGTALIKSNVTRKLEIPAAQPLACRDQTTSLSLGPAADSADWYAIAPTGKNIRVEQITHSLIVQVYVSGLNAPLLCGQGNFDTERYSKKAQTLSRTFRCEYEL